MRRYAIIAGATTAAGLLACHLIHEGINGGVSEGVRAPPVVVTFTPWLFDHIRREEGLRLKWYNDAGRRALGYGHRVGPNGPRACTRAKAERWLRADLRWFHEVVTGAVKVPISQDQHDALVAFAYNIGPTAFRRSLALERLNRGDVDGCALDMLLYVKTRGKVSRGLVLRRQREVKKFLGGLNDRQTSNSQMVRRLHHRRVDRCF